MRSQVASQRLCAFQLDSYRRIRNRARFQAENATSSTSQITRKRNQPDTEGTGTENGWEEILWPNSGLIPNDLDGCFLSQCGIYWH